MLTTPLLSLSVHEALTFDGTEIALHPDLFNESPGNVSSGASIVSNATRGRPPTNPASGATVAPTPSALSRPMHRYTQSDTAAAAALAVNGPDRDGRLTPIESDDSRHGTLSRQPSSQTLASATGGAANGTVSSSSRLEVGSMVEIRVWDPLPSRDKRRSINTSPTGGLRRRSSPPSSSNVPSANASFAEVADAKGVTRHSIASTNTVEAAASALQMSFPSNASDSNASLQYSIESSDLPSQLSAKSSSHKDDEATKSSKSNLALPPRSPARKINDISVPAADALKLSAGEKKKDEAPAETPSTSLDKDVPKTVSAQTPPRPPTVPPLFPRSRSNTTDAPQPRPTNTSLMPPPKPPTVQRNRTLAGGETTDRAALERRRPTSSIVISGPPQTIPKPRHVRDISDMTADTVTFAAGAFGTLSHNNSEQQPRIYSVPSSEHISGMPSMESAEDGTTIDDDMLSKVSATHQLRLSFTMLVTEKTLTSIKSSARTQVSILRQIAELYNLSSYDMVTITRIDKADEAALLEEVSADFVMVTIKDQFISRGDMHYFQKSLLGRWIYEGERLSQSKSGVNAHAREIRHANRLARSGIITNNTTITFRSRSARIIWLVQISSEMWDYASPYEAEHGLSEDESSCEIYFDKFVTFMYRLFEKWKEIEATHSLTVVFFSRTFLGTKKPNESIKASQERGNVDVFGRIYEDHYKTVIENETPSDWDSLVLRIKKEFVRYPLDVGWNLSSGDSERRPSNATQGNVLEAINVTLNLLTLHFMDRDLERTGNSIVVVSAGCGVFEVDKGLSEITYQRMMDDGIGSDMLSLGLPPLHIAPFFLYIDNFYSVDTLGVDTGTTYYEVPHWMHLSFASYEKEETGLTAGTELPTFFNGSDVDSSTQAHTSNLNVAANGFMLPRLTPEQRVAIRSPPRLSGLKETKSLSPHMAVISKASRSQTHQRALISGREFEDILEACRPRNVSNSMPSALVSLIHMHHRAKESAGIKSQNGPKTLGRAEQGKRSLSVESDMSSAGSDTMRTRNTRSSNESHRLTEWGSVNFNDMVGRIDRSSSIASHQIGSESASPLLALDNTDKSESSGKSSPSSSFASVYSHMLGKHADRGSSIGSYHQILPPSGIQIQRSPSLEFVPSETRIGKEADLDYHENKASGDSLSSMGTEDDFRDDKVLTSSKQAGDAMASSSAANEKHSHVDYAAYLRNLMSERDANFFASPSSSGKRAMSESSFLGAPLASLEYSPSKTRTLNQEIPSQKNGGLGAALLQYNKSGEPVAGNLNIDNMKRIRSVGMISPGALGGSRPMSPAFVGMPIGSDPPDALQLHRHRGQGIRGDLAFRNLLAPDGKAIQRLDGVAQMRQSSTPETFFPSAGKSAPSENIPRQTSGQSTSGHSRPSARHSVVDAGRRLGMSPPIDSRSFGSRSPPTGRETLRVGQKGKVKKKQKHFRQNRGHPNTNSDAVKSERKSRQRKSVFNPFRQQDEEEVLEKKTHNRRRWSHVFPKGEIEFKRHAGPNWRSLCQPAILPLTIDFHPSPQELRDPNRFYFNHYSITLRAMDTSYYTTNEELLLEMVRQRITQDFQVVPQSVINESTRRGEAERKAKLKRPISARERESSIVSRERHSPLLPVQRSNAGGTDGTIQHTLSMGHKIHELTYHPSSDSVEVIQYNAASAMHDTRDVYKYRYMLYSEATKKYSKVVQTFHKYASVARWNRHDGIICGDSESLSEGIRYRRITFGIIPEVFSDEAAELEYVGKFKRLLEYLSRLRKTEESSDELDIEILLSKNAKPNQTTPTHKTRGTKDCMRRFVVHLRKGKEDRYEWIEIAVDPTFDTMRSYRINLNWLVASAAKVDTQVQLLQRRCSQYGLKLVSFPQLSVSPNIFLYPFMAPPLTPIRDAEKAKLVEDALLKRGFLNDGVYLTGPQFRECIDGIDEFEFPLDFRKKPKNIPGQQFVHRSGTLFIRVLRDLKGWAIFIALENTRHVGRDTEMRKIAIATYQDVSEYIVSLTACVKTSTQQEKHI